MPFSHTELLSPHEKTFTHHLAIFGALLDILHQLLLLSLQLCSLPIKLPLRLLQTSLVLSQSLCWRLTAPEERFDDVHGGKALL